MTTKPTTEIATTRAEVWASRINEQTQKSVEAILDIGRMLIQAKAELPHGEWGRLFADRLVPYSIGSAERLMKIAEHPQLSNSAHVPNLPPSWGTLYELTKVEPEQLQQALTDGRVTPTMERKDAATLRVSRKRPIPASGEPVTLPSPPPSQYEWIDNKLTQLRQQLAPVPNVFKAYVELDVTERLTPAERRTIRDQIAAVRRAADAAMLHFGGKRKPVPEPRWSDSDNADAHEASQ